MRPWRVVLARSMSAWFDRSKKLLVHASAGDVLTSWESAGPSSCGVPAVFSQPVRRTRCSAGNARRLRGSLCRGCSGRRLLHRIPQCTGNPRRLGEQSKLSAVGTSVAQDPRTRQAHGEMGAEACYSDAAASGSSRSISCPTPAESEVPVQQAREGLGNHQISTCKSRNSGRG